MLISTCTFEEKNPFYQDTTPNELQIRDLEYFRCSKSWAQKEGIPFGKCYEVRLVRQQSFLEIRRSTNWWDKKIFGDVVFWVYQKSFTVPIRQVPIAFYALEYIECKRVLEACTALNYGICPFPGYENGDPPSFILPVSNCTICWEEKSGGYSDHIREMPQVRKAQEESPERLQREIELDGRARGLLKKVGAASLIEAIGEGKEYD